MILEYILAAFDKVLMAQELTPRKKEIMKKLIMTTAALMLLTAAPAMAMSCCSGVQGGMMRGKPAMAMSQASMKKGKGCCCEKMSMTMNKRC